jgi:peptidoglycan-associated lipoprotein
MDAQSTLNALGDQLKANKSAVAQIEGHCDERGSIEYNLALGDKRAQSVKNYLVQLGVETARITTVSYGEEKPAAEGHDESTWSKNRRAEFVVSSK